MASVKDREVFSLSGFRGLDTENKPLKVASFRATDGQNFVIDSDTLKSRDGFRFLKHLPFELSEDEFLIDWFLYRDVTLYITSKHIWIEHDDKIFNETEDATYFIKSEFGELDFSSNYPLFQEEKDCLFIFCLDKIYVFSTFEENYFLYDIAKKPNNVFDIETELYNFFNDLPKPYEPTIMIGDDNFEDVNLLSNVTKYEIFANATSDGQDFTTYKLPTHFDYQKHGSFKKPVSITFYKNRFGAFENIKCFPVFLGHLKENIPEIDEEALETKYGDLITDPEEVELQDVYYPIKDFEIRDTTIISEELGIDRKTFFNMKVKNSKVTIFEYMMNYIKENTFTGNKTLKTLLNVRYTEVEYDENNFIVSRTQKEKAFNIYAQFLYKDYWNFNSFIIDSETKYSTSWNDLPAYPLSDYLDGAVELETITYPDSADFAQNPSKALEEFKNRARINILQNADLYDDEDIVAVKGKIYAESHNQSWTQTYAIIMVFEISTTGTLLGDNLYSFDFNNDGFFELKVRNIFFDYNNEPSIEVKVEFEKNPDYDLIANSKFGITFGSENRLFLAGNKDYPNIDRFNISNDLLGDNIKNQSYELSYFPSKNYRVLGSKGEINGYVVATDSRLYITKAEYPNDSKLFIRNRTMDDNGIVGYNEDKTSVKRTPLNNRSIVRFNNDILMLTKDGLYAIELSGDLLTNERLEKLRSGFINKEIVAKIKTNNNPFMVENDKNLYIIFKDTMYIADTRYVAVNENQFENLSYEIIRWTLNQEFRNVKFVDSKMILLNKKSDIFYQLIDSETDDNYIFYKSTAKLFDFESNNAFIINDIWEIEDYSKVQFTFKSGYKVLAKKDIDFVFEDNQVKVLNDWAFRDIVNGSILYFRDSNNMIMREVEDFDNRESFPFDTVLESDLYIDISNVLLYVTHVFEEGEASYMRLSPYKPVEITYEKEFIDNDSYLISEGMIDCFINKPNLINTKWFSFISDFGNRLMEKTSFKIFVHVTKNKKANSFYFGYRTMRGNNYLERNKVDISNPFSFDEVDFNILGFSTFPESGLSFPMKENNFLYMQVFINSFGKLELNSIDILYKFNRMLKSVG